MSLQCELKSKSLKSVFVLKIFVACAGIETLHCDQALNLLQHESSIESLQSDTASNHGSEPASGNRHTLSWWWNICCNLQKFNGAGIFAAVASVEITTQWADDEKISAAICSNRPALESLQLWNHYTMSWRWKYLLHEDGKLKPLAVPCLWWSSCMWALKNIKLYYQSKGTVHQP